MKMVMRSGAIQLKLEVDISYKHHTEEEVDEQLKELAENFGFTYLFLEDDAAPQP